jgi:putative transcriptional regulator
MNPAHMVRLRQRLGLTQPQLAQLLGVHAMTVSKWERGDPTTAPSPYHLALIAEFEKAAASTQAAAVKDALGALLIGAGIAAALFLLLQAAKAK